MMRKWRPSLQFVLGGALAVTLTLSLSGLVALRYLGPEIGFRNAAIFLALTICLLTGVLGALLVRLLLRPIRSLSTYARSVRAAPAAPATPPQHYGTSELQQLAGAVIDMADTLTLREATIRSYSDHVTHQLKSPTAAIAAAAEMLEDGTAPGSEDRRLVDQISGAAREIQEHLDALRKMARAREANHLGETSLAALEERLTCDALRLRLTGETILLPMSAEGLALVLTELRDNAAAHGASELRIEAAESDTIVTLRITDNGSGIPKGNRARILEPFFTTRRTEGGTGMGLAIADSILKAHGGRLELADTASETCFVVHFR
ncbi:sensor histidine kinase [Vannielia litorea]|uniref:sensor histidine kinase n=1 Tax=Vannielia litorea TaxID=1217970 RepID=UPI001BCBBE2C|nr:ATP-binding protein [Vannielia litorea]MBS8225169.1 HAMP domain-containing protein [Vannielia litorea]